MPQATNNQTAREWLTGVAVIVATIVSVIGFARLSLGWTLAVSLASLTILLLLFWRTGQRKRLGNRKR